ncbi:CPBP family intramembrane glutamic endopeptidase [Aneurinibacillus tyrosinisolvens]|uniref:CPBP family intramembrane glutamic endopeptidase n=1 Tax=Aneurinibacillus tyrosinisolvens TaxID=1443435 RepID=UPI00063F3EF2|nr:CPBP family intramembrane glutamic endopeptidase [Aneurinibacillus tyrosinisolvens]
MMKSPYVRVVAVTLINIVLLGLMVKLGAFHYVKSTNVYIFGIAGTVGSLVTLLATLLFYKFVDKQPLRTLKFGMNRKQALFSLTSIIVSVGMYVLYFMLLSKRGVISAHFPGDYFANPHVIPMFIMAAVAWFSVGLNEEVLYRGYFVANFKHASPGKLFLISSVLFMASHVFQGLSPVYVLFLLGMAIVFIYIYIKSGSLLGAAIPHFIYDFLENHLIGNSSISILRIDGKPGDIHSIILLVLFIVVHITLVQVFFRQKMNRSLQNFSESISA